MLNIIFLVFPDVVNAVNLTVTSSNPLEGTTVDVTCQTSDNRITRYYFYSETTVLSSGPENTLTLQAGVDFKDGRYSCVAVDNSSMATVRWRSESKMIAVQSKCGVKGYIFYIRLFDCGQYTPLQ